MRWRGAGSLLVLFAVTLSGLAVAAGHPAGTVPPLAAAPTHAVATPITATHWGHGIAPGASLTLSRPNGVPVSATPFGNGTGCVPIPPALIIGGFGLNFSVGSTPANGSGAAPLLLTWNVTVHGGGLPPYAGTVWIMGSTQDWLFDNLSGNLSLTTPGTYMVDVYVQDSTCSQLGLADFPVFAWGAPGPHPFDVTASTNSTTVGSPVIFAANTTGLPIGWSVLFTTPQLYSNQSWVNHTFYLPGTYHATACWVDDASNIYTCATSPQVTVGGTPPIATGAIVGNGSGPVTITFWVKIVNASVLPANTSLYLYASSDTWAGWNQTNATYLTLNETAGCGSPFTAYVPLSGNCTWTAIASMLGDYNGPDLGFLGDLVIVATVPYNGSLSGFFPVGTFSYGLTNGTAPLNVTLNFSITGGQPLYRYYYSAFGRSSVLSNGTAYPLTWGTAASWNGSTTQVVLTLNPTGVYWIQVFLADAMNNFVDCALPLVYVGNVTPYVPAPLHLQGQASGNLTGTGETTVEFVAHAVGGRAPYQVEWTFGDGTFGTSLLDVPIAHTYTSVGVFQPQLTVTDASGQVAVISLTMVTVAPAAPTLPGPSINGSVAGPSTLSVNGAPVGLSIVLSAGLITLGALAVRREVRRQGDALVSEFDAEDRPAEPPWP